MSPQNILDFWFKEIDRKKWFVKDEQFDQLIRKRFGGIYNEVRQGKTEHWRTTPEGRLAEIIVLDQFARNMYRDTPQAFAGDSLALQLAEKAIDCGDDQKISTDERAFMYMPFMHSEDKQVHQRAVQLFSQVGLKENLKFEILHKKIIDQFGRYPHRNKILGRASTSEELKFLKEDNSSF